MNVDWPLFVECSRLGVNLAFLVYMISLYRRMPKAPKPKKVKQPKPAKLPKAIVRRM